MPVTNLLGSQVTFVYVLYYLNLTRALRSQNLLQFWFDRDDLGSCI